MAAAKDINIKDVIIIGIIVLMCSLICNIPTIILVNKIKSSQDSANKDIIKIQKQYDDFKQLVSNNLKEQIDFLKQFSKEFKEEGNNISKDLFQKTETLGNLINSIDFKISIFDNSVSNNS